MDDIVKSLYIFFSLSEIEYSATIDRGGMIHGWLFITLPNVCDVVLLCLQQMLNVLFYYFCWLKSNSFLRNLVPKLEFGECLSTV